MSPETIVGTALERGLDAIAITDHNSTLQCRIVQELGQEAGLAVIAGAEVTTREEAHCLALFGEEDSRAAFQCYLEAHLPPVSNDPDRFGDQVYVNRRNEIVGEVPYLLLSALDQRVDQVAACVRRLGGLFVAAHVERPSFSLVSQLGFLSPDMQLDAIEYTDCQRFARLSASHKYLSSYTCYSSSDAHYPQQIGTNPSVWQAEDIRFGNLRMAFAQVNGHAIFSSA